MQNLSYYPPHPNHTNIITKITPKIITVKTLDEYNNIKEIKTITEMGEYLLHTNTVKSFYNTIDEILFQEQ